MPAEDSAVTEIHSQRDKRKNDNKRSKFKTQSTVEEAMVLPLTGQCVKVRGFIKILPSSSVLVVSKFKSYLLFQ